MSMNVGWMVMIGPCPSSDRQRVAPVERNGGGFHVECCRAAAQMPSADGADSQLSRSSIAGTGAGPKRPAPRELIAKPRSGARCGGRLDCFLERLRAAVVACSRCPSLLEFIRE